MTKGNELTKRLRIAGFLLIGGLLTGFLTLIWSHPVSFLLYVGLGGLLMAAGIVFYLYTVVSH